MEIYLLYGMYLASIIGALGVIVLGNAVHSVLSLIVVFCFGGGILLLLGAEFVGLTLLVVYVGAIAVLFLFVVMMLKIKELEVREQVSQYYPLGFIFGIIFFADLFFIFSYGRGFYQSGELPYLQYVDWIYELDSTWNNELLSIVFFRHHVVVFLSLGFILLCAMVGAIGLTIEVRGWYITRARHQDIFLQVASSSNKSLLFVE